MEGPCNSKQNSLAARLCDTKALAVKYNIPEGLSKNQTKKLIKKYKQEEHKQEWRRKKKEMAKAKRKLKSQKQRELSDGASREVPKPKVFKRMDSGAASAVKIVIDVGYDDLMSDRIQRCYSENRRMEKPVQFYLSSFEGKCKKRFEDHIEGFSKWDVKLCAENYVEKFGKDKVVFLAAESPNVLQTLDPSKAYIIGGLVDHNHHKGHCYTGAQEQGISHARLPIEDFIKLNSRKVLAVNHVFEILLWYVNNGGDWRQAFNSVIPLRKIDQIQTDGPNVDHLLSTRTV